MRSNIQNCRFRFPEDNVDIWTQQHLLRLRNPPLCFTLDRIGRRWTLWWGAIGQAIAMFLAGRLARSGLDHPNEVESSGIGATAMVYLYTFVFGATWLTVPWLYPAEIFPLKVRAKGNAWGVVGWSLGNGYAPVKNICLPCSNNF